MIKYCIALSVSFFTLMCVCTTAHGETLLEFSRIVFVGNKRIDTEALMLQLKADKGPVRQAQIREEIKSLYLTGFFDEVTASLDEQSGEKVLVYTVKERPSVRKVFIKGNDEIGEKDLSDVLAVDAKRFLDRAKLGSVVKHGVAYYQSRGFYDAAISYDVTTVQDDQVDLTFTVTEGEKYAVASIQFKGLTTVEADELREVMQTKRYSWWKSWILGTGRVSREVLDNDRSLVRQYFLDHGYLEAAISEPQIEKLQDEELQIRFEVSEGKQFKIATIGVQGDLLEGGSEETLKGITSKAGEIFSAATVRKDAFAISDKFADIGYAFANVVPLTDIDRDNGLVNLQYEVSKGLLTTVNKIQIRGNIKTYDHVVRREMKVQEQEQYSGTKLKRSKELLQRLGYFEEVTITPQPIAGDPALVDLEVAVKEGSTGTFSVGAGYSTSDGAIFNTRLSEANLFGTGRRADLNVDIGNQRKNLILSLDDPRFNNSYVSLGTDLYITDREFGDFNRELKGIGFTAGYPLDQVFGESFQDMAASMKYEFQTIDIYDINRESAAPLVLASAGSTTSSGVTPRLVRNTINNPLNPTKGSRQILSFEVTGFGGDQEYYIAEARNTSYLPLIENSWGDIVFSYRGTLGYGDALGNGDTLPLFKRYFPGGINSVRGYRVRSLGPKDEKGNEFGGSKEFVNNFEILFPLINSAGIRGVLFYDVGEAFDDKQSIRFGDLKRAYGAGIRWMSPIGPIRLEFGIPLDHEDGKRSMMPMFSFGAPL
jgi:outer membrane protein insertion porin family